MLGHSTRERLDLVRTSNKYQSLMPLINMKYRPAMFTDMDVPNNAAPNYPTGVCQQAFTTNFD
jgi:hypothetical protein